MKKVRVALLGSGSSSGENGPKAGLIELLETIVRRDIEINLSETIVNSIDIMELNALVKAVVEFSNMTLILGVGWGLCTRGN